MQYAQEDSIMQVTHVPTSSTHVVSQGLLELLWTVYSEEMLTVEKYYAQKRPKISKVIELAKLKFTYRKVASSRLVY